MPVRNTLGGEVQKLKVLHQVGPGATLGSKPMPGVMMQPACSEKSQGEFRAGLEFLNLMN